jgi:hypothetical protein
MMAAMMEETAAVEMMMEEMEMVEMEENNLTLRLSN